MDKYCKDCTHHHVAGHPKGSPLTKYNDWCTRWSHFAKRMVSHCKLHKGRTLRASGHSITAHKGADSEV